MPTCPDLIRTLRYTLAGIALALLPGSCHPAYHAPPVTAQLVKLSPAPKSQLENGRRLYETNCAKCHTLEDPAHYDRDKLTHEIIPNMAAKAKLREADTKALLYYLLAAHDLPQRSPL